MLPDATCGRFGTARPVLLALSVLFLAWFSVDAARAEPPIRNAQDAHCRDVARSRVFSAPDPQNVGLHEVGRRIYSGCMSRSGRSAGRRSFGRRHYGRHYHRHHHHHHRHRHHRRR